jgi:hypothetical protein
MTYIKILAFNIHDASTNGWLNAAFVQSNSGHWHNWVVNLICWDHDRCTRDFLGMCMQKWLFFCSQKTWLLNNLANVCLLAVQCVPSRSDEQFHGRMVSCPGNQWKLLFFANSLLFCTDRYRLFVSRNKRKTIFVCHGHFFCRVSGKRCEVYLW